MIEVIHRPQLPDEWLLDPDADPRVEDLYCITADLVEILDLAEGHPGEALDLIVTPLELASLMRGLADRIEFYTAKVRRTK